MSNSVGRAGYIAGAIWINSIFNKEIVKFNDLYRICDSIVRSGQEYVARKSNSRQILPPLMYSYYDTEYLGAAHGLCAILQMLISVPGYIEGLGDCQTRDDIKNSIDFLLAMQTKSGNFPCAMDEAPPNPTRHENEELVHWCHGAPGMTIDYRRVYTSPFWPVRCRPGVSFWADFCCHFRPSELLELKKSQCNLEK